MTSGSSSSSAAAPHRIRNATRATMAQFFVNGATFATWGVLIPSVKERFALSDAVLSLAMLAVAGGALLTMGQSGKWIARVGSARALRQVGILYAATLLLIPLAPQFWMLVLLLLVFGSAMAAFDVAMSVQAALVEGQRTRPIMSTLHAMFSIGGIAGAALGAVPGLSPLAHAALVGVVTLAVSLSIGPFALPDEVHDSAATPHGADKRARRMVLVLGGIAFLALMCEGGMYDWAAVYMRDVAQSPMAWVSYSYAAFSTGMAAGRLTGDRIRARIGGLRTLAWSGAAGAAGIALAAAWPSPLATLGGLLLSGLGIANLMPIFFLAAARVPGMAAAESIAAVARFAYVGMLLGPVFIGGVAEHLGLRLSFVGVALVMTVVALFGGKAVRRFI
ncbi:MFS transporter [Herbaspirillum seropedicae]|uniref:Permease of the major facilitator superfamily protein n=1 Tax=Herbaspirillum seropedicae (strain SmR1) TaxID=757424 RepID=D8J0Z0_HERSS|nr:MFS transporter [Herbaspirillum seropedicae]ADJ62545.1 permease of the major facilitator superfamily protein [Herbaspirillum seropedicae SmR1]AKN64659.1 amino acid ABC transporter permease [Herbaspirillum seropedicae]NQE30920.1 amino acid ABC transporter permease [Herbaspirillum seropedicae]UMU20598.1 MFS transporter [Herbaspirillum seropedicae]